MIALLSALWLGVLTSISPCPLATNIAAISFLSKRINHPKAVLMLGMAYTLGRMVSYVVLGLAIITSLTKVSFIANFLQKYMNMALGPILLTVGLFLLGVVKFNLSSFALSQDKQKNLAEKGLIGAFLLGAIFALSFCPISAALFFGSLIPLAMNHSYGIALPFLYGIGTGLPVVIFAFGIAFGIESFSHWFRRLSNLEKYMRKITGAIFALVGLYYIWAYLISLI